MNKKEVAPLGLNTDSMYTCTNNNFNRRDIARILTTYFQQSFFPYRDSKELFLLSKKPRTIFALQSNSTTMGTIKLRRAKNVNTCTKSRK